MIQRFDKVFNFSSEMGKFMKPGKVVMVLAGRYAGRKAVIVKVRRVDAMCPVPPRSSSSSRGRSTDVNTPFAHPDGWCVA